MTEKGETLENVDTFFSQKECDRCGWIIDGSRIMSWFTKDCLCDTCSKLEDKIKRNMRESGKNPDHYEGCGYIPNEYLSGAIA